MIDSIGLVFAGGFAKGAYQIGFCKALSDLKLTDKIRYISAASVGTLNAYSLLTGKLDKAEEIWLRANTKCYREFIVELLKRMKIYDYIDELCQKSDFLSVPLFTVNWTPPKTHSDYVNLSEMPFDKRLRYLKSSISVPPFMKPININGVTLYDGAVLENVPVNPPVRERVDLLIVAQFDAFMEPIEKIYANESLFLNLDSNSNKINSFCADSKSVEKMIKYGYDYSYDVLKLILAGENNEKALSNTVSIVNNSIKGRIISGDRMVRRLNKISKMIDMI